MTLEMIFDLWIREEKENGSTHQLLRLRVHVHSRHDREMIMPYVRETALGSVLVREGGDEEGDATSCKDKSERLRYHIAIRYSLLSISYVVLTFSPIAILEVQFHIEYCKRLQ